MSPDELDNELEELENRLERLRALYDQYFLGIEKIEPSIARKDVDRRIWMLRREQIRNTARRFRLQTLVMRYNTFQQYWQRICRDIENGTYTRHMLRAERNIGEAEGLTIAARKRLGMFRRGAEKRDEREQRREGEEAQSGVMTPPPGAPAAESEPAVEQSTAVPRPKLDDLDLDMDFFAALEGPEPPAPSAPRAAPVPRAPAPRAAAAPPVGPAGSRAGLLSRLGPKGVAPPVAAPEPKPLEAAATGEARRASTPPPATAAGLNRPAADRAARLAPAAPPHRPAAASSEAAAKAPSGDHRGVANVPKAAAPAPARAPNAAAPAASAEKSARQVAGKPAAPDRSAPKNPAPQKRPASPAQPSAASPPKAAPKPAGVTDERIRELHGRLVDAKRQVNDAGKVSVDGLTKSLRAAESRLRQQHGDRRIDFDVVIKDGKAVVKPILR